MALPPLYPSLRDMVRVSSSSSNFFLLTPYFTLGYSIELLRAGFSKNYQVTESLYSFCLL